jgi:hypothetical protein
MITVRQIQRLWDEHAYGRLAGLLGEGRSDLPEDAPRGSPSVSAAALGIIRLDELAQSSHPVCARFIRSLLNAQQPDGGWGEIGLTVLAIRALRCANGDGEAIARGIQWLADLQKEDGAWPMEPVRRLPADAGNTTFVLLHLGNDPLLRARARLDDALAWISSHHHEMDAGTRRVADRVVVRRKWTSTRSSADSTTAWLFAEAA